MLLKLLRVAIGGNLIVTNHYPVPLAPFPVRMGFALGLLACGLVAAPPAQAQPPENADLLTELDATTAADIPHDQVINWWNQQMADDRMGLDPAVTVDSLDAFLEFWDGQVTVPSDTQVWFDNIDGGPLFGLFLPPAPPDNLFGGDEAAGNLFDAGLFPGDPDHVTVFPIDVPPRLGIEVDVREVGDVLEVWGYPEIGALDVGEAPPDIIVVSARLDSPLWITARAELPDDSEIRFDPERDAPRDREAVREQMFQDWMRDIRELHERRRRDLEEQLAEAEDDAERERIEEALEGLEDAEEAARDEQAMRELWEEMFDPTTPGFDRAQAGTEIYQNARYALDRMGKEATRASESPEARFVRHRDIVERLEKDIERLTEQLEEAEGAERERIERDLEQARRIKELQQQRRDDAAAEMEPIEIEIFEDPDAPELDLGGLGLGDLIDPIRPPHEWGATPVLIEMDTDDFPFPPLGDKWGESGGGWWVTGPDGRPIRVPGTEDDAPDDSPFPPLDDKWGGSSRGFWVTGPDGRPIRVPVAEGDAQGDFPFPPFDDKWGRGSGGWWVTGPDGQPVRVPVAEDAPEPRPRIELFDDEGIEPFVLPDRPVDIEVFQQRIERIEDARLAEALAQEFERAAGRVFPHPPPFFDEPLQPGAEPSPAEAAPVPIPLVTVFPELPSDSRVDPVPLGQYYALARMLQIWSMLLPAMEAVREPATRMPEPEGLRQLGLGLGLVDPDSAAPDEAEPADRPTRLRAAQEHLRQGIEALEAARDQAADAGVREGCEAGIRTLQRTLDTTQRAIDGELSVSAQDLRDWTSQDRLHRLATVAQHHPTPEARQYHYWKGLPEHLDRTITALEQWLAERQAGPEDRLREAIESYLELLRAEKVLAEGRLEEAAQTYEALPDDRAVVPATVTDPGQQPPLPPGVIRGTDGFYRYDPPAPRIARGPHGFYVDQAGARVTSWTPPQSLVEELEFLRELRRRLREGDTDAILDALEFLEWKHGPRPDGVDPVDWLRDSSEFGSAMETFIHVTAADARRGLREGDETAIGDAMDLLEFLGEDRAFYELFGVNPTPAQLLAWSRLFSNALRDFIRRKLEEINERLEAGDPTAIADAIEWFEFTYGHLYRFRRIPYGHALLSESPDFVDAYGRFLELEIENINQRLRAGDESAVQDALEHLEWKHTERFERPPSGEDAVRNSSEFGEAFVEGFGGR